MTGLSLQPPTRSVMLPSRPRLLSLLTLVFALLSATVAIAQPDPRVEARAHYQAGVAKYTAAQYDEAVAEFRAAEQLAPSPMNDYNIGLALDRKGDATGAIAAYRAYLDRAPNAANRADVEAAIAKLKPAAEPAAAPPASTAAAATGDDLAFLTAEQRADRARMIAALDECVGNQTRAARALGIARSTLVAKLALYRIPRPRG